MSTLSMLSDDELVARLPALVQIERQATADVIEHLVEVERRRLYLEHATSSLYRYCIERLGYSEDAGLKRHRVARLVLRLPRVLDELRNGSIQLTGLFLLSTHLTEDNAAALLGEARGKSRRQIEEIIARWFPRPDVATSVAMVGTSGVPLALSVEPVGTTPLPDGGTQMVVAAGPATRPGTGGFEARGRFEPLSPARVRVEFTARAELGDKLEQARRLLSHALPSGDLGELFERALDALLEKETRRRFGAGRPRKRRTLKQGSRHVPVEVERTVWQRDGAQCTFVDTEGRRCSERHFLTIEHRHPFALGGLPTPDNLCLLCKAHNLASARAVFGEEQIAATIEAQRRDASRELGDACSDVPAPEQVTSLGVSHSQATAPANAALALSALCRLGFPRPDAAAVIGRIRGSDPHLGIEQLLRESLPLLVPTRAA